MDSALKCLRARNSLKHLPGTVNRVAIHGVETDTMTHYKTRRQNNLPPRRAGLYLVMDTISRLL